MSTPSIKQNMYKVKDFNLFVWFSLIFTVLPNHLPLLTVYCVYRLMNKNIYYMASSASGQDDPNRAMWSATRAGKMEPSCPLWTTRCIPQDKLPRKPSNKSFIDQVCSIKMAGYWPRSFFASLLTSTSSRSINTQKRTWPKSSHLDLTLGQ